MKKKQAKPLKKAPNTLEIVYPVCCGMDVHKSFIVACIAVTDNHGQTEHHIRRFSTFSKDLRKLAEWLASFDCRDVCMESTGKYWIPVFNVLEKTCNVCLTHPKYVKAIKGKKTDKRDAKWIAELFKCDIPRSSFIPPPLIRQLRELCRYLVKLTNTNTSEKNRAHNCLTTGNFKLDDVFSDLSGASATRVIEKLLEQGNSDFDVAPLLDKRCKATVEEVAAALDGELNVAQTEKLKFIRSHQQRVAEIKVALEALIVEMAKPLENEIKLLMTVPGVSTKLTAIRILAEIGTDMSVFETAKHLVSWAGLCPQNNESGGKKKTTRISRAGEYLKPLLVQLALNDGKSNKCPELKNKYVALKKRRGGKKAVIAIARKLTIAFWHILSKREEYKPNVCQKADRPPQNRVLTQQQAFALLRAQGYSIVVSDSPSVAA